MSNNSLPIILVSAGDVAIASKFIEELIDNEVSECEAKEEDGKVWQIQNKYYRVNVQLIPLADGQPLPAAWETRIEGHIVYFTEAEEGDERIADVAEERVAPHDAGADVRVAVCAGAGAEADGLRGWARRRRYELVPLREEPDGDRDTDGPFAETYGAARVRAALHAHTWRGLERLDGIERARRAVDVVGPTSSDSDYEGFDSDADSEGAVERAEEFAAALRVLSAAGGGAAGGGARRAGGGVTGGERRRAAERLVAAVCRALGSDLPAL